jgi:cellulose biosynthesis protein BcsQ
VTVGRNANARAPSREGGMKSIAFFNNKGGVGKTTLLCNFAAYVAKYMAKKVCVVDADPQCNATQYLLPDDEVENIYLDSESFTINTVIQPLSYGQGYSSDLIPIPSVGFGLDLIPGDPNLALTEDFLARDWASAKSGEIRGIRTSLVFSELLGKLDNYDFVLFDVGPSLGAINRSILLSSDFFVSPMSIDIFSLRSFENISRWVQDWTDDWERGIEGVKTHEKSLIPDLRYGQANFIGYVTQQYMAKKDKDGNSRPVKAYEQIRQEIDSIIDKVGFAKGISGEDYEIGTVPNLFSLVPMSQYSHVPVFELKSSDGVVGSHFTKVKEALEIFKAVSEEIVARAS